MKIHTIRVHQESPGINGWLVDILFADNSAISSGIPKSPEDEINNINDCLKTIVRLVNAAEDQRTVS